MTFEEALAADGVSQERAHDIFDSLDTVTPEQMFGTWKGGDFPSNHPTDGQLSDGGWFGKRFTDTETVDPLLFIDSEGTGFFPVDPTRVMERVAAGTLDKVADIRAEVETDKPAARLRSTMYRGKVTATMVYDSLPINDVFRRVDENTLLGTMDARGDNQNFFFVLRRSQ